MQVRALTTFAMLFKSLKSAQNLRKVPETQHFLAIFYSQLLFSILVKDREDVFKARNGGARSSPTPPLYFVLVAFPTAECHVLNAEGVLSIHVSIGRAILACYI